jgi:hypothetical protein
MPIKPSRLYKFVQKELRKHFKKNSLPQISEYVGLSPQWLHLVLTDKIKSPSVDKIEHLYEKLTGRKLGF